MKYFHTQPYFKKSFLVICKNYRIVEFVANFFIAFLAFLIIFVLYSEKIEKICLSSFKKKDFTFSIREFILIQVYRFHI